MSGYDEDFDDGRSICVISIKLLADESLNDVDVTLYSGK